ncbi:MAG: hypothetical protein JW883_12395 [Deltaproteobacteria bacterium]|nr:hypothetical protein [Deltaproteobacteria bacterium]
MNNNRPDRAIMATDKVSVLQALFKSLGEYGISCPKEFNELVHSGFFCGLSDIAHSIRRDLAASADDDRPVELGDYDIADLEWAIKSKKHLTRFLEKQRKMKEAPEAQPDSTSSGT